MALSVTGASIQRHHEDFIWLRHEKAEGRLKILWVNHSFTHPYRRGLPDGENFLLTPGLDRDDEIANVERLLIANGETPSVFFRYPGLISDADWASRLREAHLISLGADAWLALGAKPGPGGVILVHPNGNEPAGLVDFERLNQLGALPKPFRPHGSSLISRTPGADAPWPESVVRSNGRAGRDRRKWCARRWRSDAASDEQVSGNDLRGGRFRFGGPRRRRRLIGECRQTAQHARNQEQTTQQCRLLHNRPRNDPSARPKLAGSRPRLKSQARVLRGHLLRW